MAKYIVYKKTKMFGITFAFVFPVPNSHSHVMHMETFPSKISQKILD